MNYGVVYGGADKSLARPGRKQATTTEDFDVHISYLIIIGGILVLFIYITRLASNEIFPRSNKIHRKVGRSKDYQQSGINNHLFFDSEETLPCYSSPKTESTKRIITAYMPACTARRKTLWSAER